MRTGTGKPTPTAELLAEAGKLFYPDSPGWLDLMGEDLKVNPTTLQKWFSGKSAISADYDVVQRAEQLLRDEAKLYLDLAKRIKRERQKAIRAKAKAEKQPSRST